jgi:hypothetical protein
MPQIHAGRLQIPVTPPAPQVPKGKSQYSPVRQPLPDPAPSTVHATVGVRVGVGILVGVGATVPVTGGGQGATATWRRIGSSLQR